MWEQRYGALMPARTEGNTRYYDGDQLRRLLNIVSLMNTGKKISQIGPLTDEELFTLVNKETHAISEHGNSAEYFISQLVTACLTYNESYFEKMFSSAIVRYGLKDMYVQIIYPLLQRIGMMWAGNSLPPPNEHFIVNLIRQKICSAVDALPPATIRNEKWILFLPEGEYHEIGLLLANFLVRKSGRNTIYLGPDVPLSGIEHALASTHPTHLLTFIVHKDSPEFTSSFLHALHRHFRGDTAYIAIEKEAFEEVDAPKIFVPVYDVEQLLQFLGAKKNKRSKVSGI